MVHKAHLDLFKKQNILWHHIFKSYTVAFCICSHLYTAFVNCCDADKSILHSYVQMVESCMKTVLKMKKHVQLIQMLSVRSIKNKAPAIRNVKLPKTNSPHTAHSRDMCPTATVAAAPKGKRHHYESVHGGNKEQQNMQLQRKTSETNVQKLFS